VIEYKVRAGTRWAENKGGARPEKKVVEDLGYIGRHPE
jgi:hypothetical protein